MEIISHRGFWKESVEKNSVKAFERSFSLGFGTETDLRDFGSSVVISHDIPSGKELCLSDFLDIYSKTRCTGLLALNIKADSLQDEIIKQLNSYQVENYFLFDMSVPDALVSLQKGLICYARYSEYEPKSENLWEKSQGIWYDSFHGGSLNTELVKEVIRGGKRVCIVSPELHGRECGELWQEIMNLDREILASDYLILCTDIPKIARDFFHEN